MSAKVAEEDTNSQDIEVVGMGKFGVGNNRFLAISRRRRKYTISGIIVKRSKNPQKRIPQSYHRVSISWHSQNHPYLFQEPHFGRANAQKI
jgi:hypothetical protein